MIGKFRRRTAERIVRDACYVGVLAMVLIAWSVVDPRPLPVMMAMTVGGVCAAVAFLLYVLAMALPHPRSKQEQREQAAQRSSPPDSGSPG